jgi:hypothetical protein
MLTLFLLAVLGFANASPVLLMNDASFDRILTENVPMLIE